MTSEQPRSSDPADDGLVLYGYWRSSASYRVRMALNLKGLDYEQRFVHLVRDGGEQFLPDYIALNAQGQVPTLLHGERVLTQSPAIVEYIDEVYCAERWTEILTECTRIIGANILNIQAILMENRTVTLDDTGNQCAILH